jgi:hypothetical protein
MLRIRFPNNNHHVVKIVTQYYQIEETKFLQLFLPSIYSYQIVNHTDNADICFVDVSHENNNLLRNNEVNILYCIENLSVGRGWYAFYNSFGRYNPKIDIYLYNDISIKTENTIPIINKRIEYFKKMETLINIDNVPFKDKKFCLFVSKNNLNINKNSIIKMLSTIDKVDFINMYDDILLDKSCYNDETLLKIFNQYKFIVCFENSKTDGYITEKIFNVFLAKAIPIYDGAPNITSFIDPNSFIAFDGSIMVNIYLLNNNETKYNEMINSNKIVDADYSTDDIFTNIFKRKIAL